MKQLYFFLCLLFTTTLFAQDITPEVDIKLQLLNKNYVTTDILYDRVFPLANLMEFNQIASDTSHINIFIKLIMNCNVPIITTGGVQSKYLKRIWKPKPQFPLGSSMWILNIWTRNQSLIISWISRDRTIYW